jgi:LuxR family maltose regulon positive regulatory protein
MHGEFGVAGQWLNMLLAGAESGERWGRVIELLILQAIIFNAQDNREAALKTFTRALEIAQGEGYVRTFVDGGQPVAELLGETASGVGVTEYANKVLAAFPDDNKESREKESTAHSAAPPNGRPSSLMEPLSDRELEVLQLIAEGLTNKEIAVRIHISLGTVKVHAHNIYSKLGVNGRTQAVAKARTLNILS